MLDLRTIRDDPAAFDAGLAKRGHPPMAERVLALDGARRATLAALQEAQARRNALSKEIGRAKAAPGGDGTAAALLDEVAALKARIQEGEEQARRIEAELDALLAALPNLPAEDVPVGPDESANVEQRRVGAAPDFAFPPREHFEIGEALGGMDFEAASRISGARFVVLRGPLARLERALAAFMLDLHRREFGYTEVSPPLLVREEAMFGTAQLPKFAEEQFQTREGYWLIPTAEVPLTNLVREAILDEAELPLRLTACTPCFRAEAGAAGRDTRGLIRQHQFFKVELVSITTPDQARAEHERMTACAEEVLKRLGLHYRVMLLSSGDMGFAARRTYDLEVWMAGQGRFREISSCSWCGDFQARRMQARFRPQSEKGTRFVHTLNGSALAIGRTLAAVLEHYQRADGGVDIPEVLRPYMGGAEEIDADARIARQPSENRARKA